MEREENKGSLVPHPMRERSAAYRYRYCFGLGVLAMGNMRAITELQPYYERLLRQLLPDQDQYAQIITDINNDLERHLELVRQTVCDRVDQCCFLLDVYKMCLMAVWSVDYCQAIFDQYVIMFQISKREREFICAFGEAAAKQDQTLAAEQYERYEQLGGCMPFAVLRYIYPDFLWKQTRKGFTVHTGETIYLHGKQIIDGDILVETGATLWCEEAEITMDGAIRVQGGRVHFQNCKICVENCSQKYFITMTAGSSIMLTATVLDCQSLCGAIYQQKGSLLVKDSRLCRSARVPLVHFAGEYAEFQNTGLQNGLEGLLVFEDPAKVYIHNCRFVNGTRDYGGAIYSETFGSVRIRQCQFVECHAKYLGAAVYFQNYRCEQTISGCEVISDQNVQEAFFQNYKEGRQ